MLDLKRRGPDVRRFVATLEEWIIRTLAAFNVAGERREDRIGVWVRRPDKGGGREDKIAAIGIRVKRWVTLHGIALNVDCDLSHFAGIVPCGVSEPRYGVTSLADLGADGDHGGGRRGVAARIRAAVRPDHALTPSSSTENALAASGRSASVRRPCRLALIDGIDARARRSVPARLDHRRPPLRPAGKHRLDRAVAAVAHPAFEPAIERGVFGPGAVADALHAAADDDVTDASLIRLLRCPWRVRRASLTATSAQRTT